MKSLTGDLAVTKRSCYLTAVLPSFPVSRAYEYMRDVLPEPGLLVHRLALGVVDDGEGDLLQNGGQWTVCNDVMCYVIITITITITFLISNFLFLPS